MSERFVLWGSSGHAKVLFEIIRGKGGRVLALFDNEDVPSAFPHVPVYQGKVGFCSWIDTQDNIERISGLVAIGGGRGRDRLAIQRMFRKRGLQIPIMIHPAATVSSSAKIGAGTQILATANVAAESRLGEACIINHRASIDHECVVGDGVHIAPGATLCGCIAVGDNAFIGAGAVVLPRISIGANTVIGAGSVVTRDVAGSMVVAGNPARIIKKIKGS